MSANTRLDSLHDLVKHRANLRVTCPCGRVHIYDAERFCRFALLRRWNAQLEALAHRVRCSACGRRGPALKAVPDAPTAVGSIFAAWAAWISGLAATIRRHDYYDRMPQPAAVPRPASFKRAVAGLAADLAASFAPGSSSSRFTHGDIWRLNGDL